MAKICKHNKECLGHTAITCPHWKWGKLSRPSQSDTEEETWFMDVLLPANQPWQQLPVYVDLAWGSIPDQFQSINLSNSGRFMTLHLYYVYTGRRVPCHNRYHKPLWPSRTVSLVSRLFKGKGSIISSSSASLWSYIGPFLTYFAYHQGLLRLWHHMAGNSNIWT
jgi:hypothetical protein